MRFEIGPGGGFVILVGLLGLSAAVFFLGMISGREMAETEQSQTQLASVYPMPAGAPSAAAPQPVPAVPAQASVPSAAGPAPAAPKPPPQTAAVSQPANPAQPPRQVASVQRKPTARPALASASRPHLAPSAEDESSADTSESDEAGSGEETPATRPPPGVGAHHGYNIVIDAAMDRQAAYRMSSRLLALGYTSHIVPTQINGQTWYRVQVGPYPTSEDARAAQAQLRAAYTARYVNRAGATGAAASSAAGESSDSASSDSDSGSDDSGADAAPSD